MAEGQAGSRCDRAAAALFPALAARFGAADDGWPAFERRLERHFPPLFEAFSALYGARGDLIAHLTAVLETAARSWLDRPADLRDLDAAREKEPDWFQSHEMVGAVCYVDLFAGDLAGLRARLPYFRSLGLTYLHLMPLLRSPEGDNDGGYAVSDYRETAPHIGTMAELAETARAFRRAGISLVLDFVLNHTADDHGWAQRAKAGDAAYQDFYFMFDDRSEPDRYEGPLREIFPDRGPGAFTWRTDVQGPNGGKWVWTTFNRFQWDLNLSNPAVFNALAGEMLFLANQGAEVLRLDAVPFIWKRLGTNCENQPEAHIVVQGLNALARIAAPCLLFKSEAIVHPDEVQRYVAPGESQLSYNPMLMVLLWEALATRRVGLTRHALAKRFALPPGCAWVNYIRCHDDIGWGFADEDAAALGINGFDHRRFLNAFYSGRFEGSFARGLPFQENPRTGDARICGMLASLAGLEWAMEWGDGAAVRDAVARVLLMHGVIMTIGGIPLIYLGDEVGLTNDYGFSEDPAKAADNRWVHRPVTDWPAQEALRAAGPSTPGGQIFEGLRKLIALRKANPVFAGGATEMISTGSDHVLGYARTGEGGPVVVLASFTEASVSLDGAGIAPARERESYHDLLTGETVSLSKQLTLKPYQFLCLAAVE